MNTMVMRMVVLLSASVAFAGSDTLYFENDFFADRDYDYTHGTKLSHELGDGWGAYLWQGIYTPRDKDSPTVVPGDRPYAGWLAFGVDRRYHWLGVRHLTEASLGVVGPSSMSEQSQTYIHKALGNDVPSGWDDQLEDEPAVELRHEIRKAVPILDPGDGWFSAYVVPQSEVAVGTVMDYFGIGGDVVFGYHPDPYFENQISMKAPGAGWGAYAFAGVRGRAVAWNMLLDGNMWHDSPSVERETLVGDLQCGACVRTPWASLTFTMVSRSREFETQDGHETFGVLSLTASY